MIPFCIKLSWKEWPKSNKKTPEGFYMSSPYRMRGICAVQLEIEFRGWVKVGNAFYDENIMT